MKTILPLLLSLVFLILALWHFRMALLPAGGANGGAVPSVGGKPLFVPSAGATVAVGLLLLGCAGLVAATAGMIPVSVPLRVLHWLSLALALGLLARAIGEFKYLGFFKSVRGSRFASLDTFVYSPLCLLLAIGVAIVALRTGM
jgi:hypothetical protein